MTGEPVAPCLLERGRDRTLGCLPRRDSFLSFALWVRLDGAELLLDPPGLAKCVMKGPRVMMHRLWGFILSCSGGVVRA